MAWQTPTVDDVMSEFNSRRRLMRHEYLKRPQRPPIARL